MVANIVIILMQIFFVIVNLKINSVIKLINFIDNIIIPVTDFLNNYCSSCFDFESSNCSFNYSCLTEDYFIMKIILKNFILIKRSIVLEFFRDLKFLFFYFKYYFIKYFLSDFVNFKFPLIDFAICCQFLVFF